MTDRELMQQALEALTAYDGTNGASQRKRVLAALRERLAREEREWVGLTEEDFSAINQSSLTKLQAATSAESILKEKNT
jgi:hypothetical protein